jgi:hypothetical protein
MQRGAPKKRRKTLADENLCTCHPKSYGLKKGLRRARRRTEPVVIRSELESEG